MPSRLFILGSGFGSLELSTTLLSTKLSEAMGKRVIVTLIDKSEGPDKFGSHVRKGSPGSL